MKNNIREELETKYLKEELVNDNTLLLYEEVAENDILVKMRYIRSNKIHEGYITHLTKKEFEAGDRIVFNDDNTALAVFKKYKAREVLTDVVDLETHYSECSDFMDCAYNMKFNNKVDDYLRLVKTK